jgi:PAS domain-containing protein
VGYYHDTLKASPEALAYLKTRGLEHPELIERFKLGFANRTLGLRLPEKNRKAGEEMRSRLQRIGILRESGHEHFNGSLVIPVLDEQGNVTEVYGRKITESLRKGTPLHLYLPGPHRGVWNVEALQGSQEVILCEALIDALTFWCAGYRNVTASYGIEGFTEDHLSAFNRYGTERVLIAYDRDEAGERAAEKLAAMLMAQGIECWRIQFPKGMDANEYALKVTPAAKSLGLAIRKASWLGRGVAPERAHQVDAAAVDVEPTPAIAVLPSAAKEKTLPITDSVIAEPLPASPVPSAPGADIKDSEIVMRFAERRYRVRGLHKNLSYELLKVNVLAACGEAFYVDTLDLYSARQRSGYITQAAVELQLSQDVLKADLGRVLLKLEQLQDEQIRQALEPKPIEAIAMSAEEQDAALALLRDPGLLDRILADFEACGIVGERTNKLVGYLAAVSRKLDAPLAVVIQSSSAAGKSLLMDAVLALMPEEERVKYSAMTGQSLFYMGSTNLKHKILAIVEEEGASRASYALKLLQSEGELTIASTGKDPTTGNLVTQEYRVEGPVMLFLTTTAIDIDPELQNRCLTLAIDEGRAQTQAIHRLQRERRTLEGLRARARRHAILAVHRNAQRLLKPLGVLNPYARSLTFPDEATRTRRAHEHYLTLIDAIALLHQHQRELHATREGDQLIEYVEVTLDDIAIANQLAHEVLGRSLDELPPQTRRLLLLIEEHVHAECERLAIARSAYHFSRRQLREALGWSDTQLRVHLERLVELEYLIAHRDGPGGRFVYELLYDGQGQDGEAFLCGLIEVEALRSTTTTSNSRGVDTQVAGRLRANRGPVAGRSRVDESGAESISTRLCEESSAAELTTHISGGNAKDRSYTQEPVVPLAAASR